jgi:hypothetical protein
MTLAAAFAALQGQSGLCQIARGVDPAHVEGVCCEPDILSGDGGGAGAIPAEAAPAASARIPASRKADVQRTCPGIQLGGGRIQACMKDHFAEYSEPCKQAIVTAKFGTR